MSLSSNELVKAVKQAAVEASEATKPFALVFGTVISPEPNLKIKVDQKLTLDSQQLILTNNVRDYTVYMTTAGEDKSGREGDAHYTSYEEQIDGSPNPTQFSPHRHEYKGKKKWKIHLKLKANESVILLRCNGGQKYIVLDRTEALNE